MNKLILLLTFAAVIYVSIATLVFQYRHPYMNDLYILLNIKTVLSFGRVE